MSKLRDIYFKYNFINKISLKKDRKKLKNENISIICSNCIGGLIYHDLGLQFLSPTINLSIDSPDFVKMVSNLEYYMSLDPVEIKDDRYECPCAMIGDIEVHFTHYSSFEEGKIKWNERKKRINYENIYVFTNDHDGMEEQDFELLTKCKVKNSVVFTSKDFNSSNACKIYKYEGLECVGNILKKNKITGRGEYWKWFRVVDFLNSNGQPANTFKK